MYKRFLFLLTASLTLGLSFASDLRAQTVLQDFSLKNANDSTHKMVSLGNYPDKKAFAVVFTGLHCVYSKKYEDRIIKLAAEYAPRGVQFILINSNSSELSYDDNFEAMQVHAQERKYDFPFLQDADQAVARQFGALKNPDIYILAPSPGGFSVIYSGLIDDNPLLAEAVTINYASKALEQLLSGNSAPMVGVQVQGCGIKGLEE